MRLPDFYVIGAQKAGSTYLLRCLRDHPQTEMPRKEVSFFEDPDYDPDRLSKVASLYGTAGRDQRCGLKRPNYLGLPEIPSRLVRHTPNAKLIAVLRDPVDRVISAYYHYVRAGFAPIRPINRGLTALLDGESDPRFPIAEQVLTFGLYHEHLTRYLESFADDQMLVLLYDDIRSDPDRIADQAYRFLGIDPEFRPEAMERRAMPGVYSMAKLRLSEPFRRIGVQYFHGRRRIRRRGGPVGRLGYCLHRAIQHPYTRFVLPEKRPDLTPTVRQRLTAYYRDDTTRLNRMLSDRIAHWMPLQPAADPS